MLHSQPPSALRGGTVSLYKTCKNLACWSCRPAGIHILNSCISAVIGDPFFQICKGKFSPFIEECRRAKLACRRAKLACPRIYHLLFQEVVAWVHPVPVDVTTSLLPPPFSACHLTLFRTPRQFVGLLLSTTLVVLCKSV